jgi:alanyl-tRNA synthetase
VQGGPPGSPDEDGDRYVEIWNLVFMQFDRAADGTLTPLPKPSVDTGMGLERIAAVMQGVHSNYDIDLFRNLISAAADVTRQKDVDSPSLRVIADHIRACTFLILDGVLPSNEGRGYVLRRIIRRAIRHGYKLGQGEPFFHRLVQVLADQMGAAYPELVAAARTWPRACVLKQEEERFAETLATGMALLESRSRAGGQRRSRARSPSSSTTPTASRWTSPPTSPASAASRWTRPASRPPWRRSASAPGRRAASASTCAAA